MNEAETLYNSPRTACIRYDRIRQISEYGVKQESLDQFTCMVFHLNVQLAYIGGSFQRRDRFGPLKDVDSQRRRSKELSAASDDGWIPFRSPESGLHVFVSNRYGTDL